MCLAVASSIKTLSGRTSLRRDEKNRSVSFMAIPFSCLSRIKRRVSSARKLNFASSKLQTKRSKKKLRGSRNVRNISFLDWIANCNRSRTEETANGDSLLQLFGDDIGVRAVDFIVVAHGNGRKRQVPYQIRRVDGGRYRVPRVIRPQPEHKHNAERDGEYADLPDVCGRV